MAGTKLVEIVIKSLEGRWKAFWFVAGKKESESPEVACSKAQPRRPNCDKEHDASPLDAQANHYILTGTPANLDQKEVDDAELSCLLDQRIMRHVHQQEKDPQVDDQNMVLAIASVLYLSK